MTQPYCNFILCQQDDGYELVGPFKTREALVAYGLRWQAEHGDDPRWQSLHLDDPHAPPRVIDPGAFA